MPALVRIPLPVPLVRLIGSVRLVDDDRDLVVTEKAGHVVSGHDSAAMVNNLSLSRHDQVLKLTCRTHGHATVLLDDDGNDSYAYVNMLATCLPSRSQISITILSCRNSCNRREKAEDEARSLLLHRNDPIRVCCTRLAV